MSLGKPAGRGYKALDYDTDRTITENSENSSNENSSIFMHDPTASGHIVKKKGRGDDDPYLRKPIYSTDRDK
jgi:hypothetical protein